MSSKRGTFSSVLLFLTLIRGLNGEIFSSTAQLSEAIIVERKIVGQIQSYIEDSEAKISSLRTFIETYNHKLDPTDEVITNPLSAFKIIKRLAVHWQKVTKLLSQSLWEDLTQQIHSDRIGFLIPKKKDVEGAALGILRLQKTYQLNASDLVRGNILGIQNSIELTTGDCVYIGKKGFNHGHYDLAIDWYRLALRKGWKEANSVVKPQKIMQYLNAATKQHSKAMTNEEEYREQNVFSDPINSASPKYKLGLEISNQEEYTNYNALCRGEQLRSDSELASLKCYLSDRGDGSFYINPIKVEVHSHDPPIVTFHDIIYESEINFIKEFSKPHLKRSLVYGDDESKEVSNERISQNVRLYDNEKDEQLRRKVKMIMDRVSRITGLNVHGKNNSEALQVANYGIGGYYVKHYDFFYQDLPPKEFARYNPFDYQTIGDRLATLMFYLSDVKLGGATVFPLIGAAVWPRKGSAAFWYNIRRNGEPDFLTLHAGCPVLHGSKWIGNKWIREFNQVFKRPCSRYRKD